MENIHNTIVIPCADTYEFLKLKDIVRLESLQNYTRIFMLNGDKFISSKNIGKYKKELEEQGFYHCHKSHIINVSLIRKYYKTGYCLMADSSNVPVSRRRKQDFITEVILSAQLPSRNSYLESEMV